MSDSGDPCEFVAPVLFDPAVEAGYMKHFVPIPSDVAARLGSAKRRVGSVDGRPFRRVMHRRPDGSPCLKFGEGWLREAGLPDGTEVLVVLGEDPNPDAVDLPDELQAALSNDAEAKLLWTMLTPGKQRTLAYGVERAKRPDTRRRRAAAVPAALVAEID
ncbi:MAG: YdeI/OmpD-associated family protein [Sandaracinaceae bacterium]